MKSSKRNKQESRVKAGCKPNNDFSISMVAVLVFITGLLCVPLQAKAAVTRYVLNFEDSFIRSNHRQPATIFLKRTLKEQYPHVNLRNINLGKVVLVAKTQRGMGGAELRVGKRRSESFYVHGNHRDFHNPRPFTFDRVHFANPSRDSRGKWRMNLWGNFVVRKVVLVVDEHRPARKHKPIKEHYSYRYPSHPSHHSYPYGDWR